MDLWSDLTEKYQLPVRTGEEFTGVEGSAGHPFQVSTNRGRFSAHFVCLALGRRGSPRKLNVPGEDLPKVAYSLIDAQSYQHRKVMVVGGGDSAIEAALGLAEQPGNAVTLSYRKSGFFRLKARNEARLNEALQGNRLDCIFDSQVKEIRKDLVMLTIAPEGKPPVDRAIANDEIFVMVGGIPPFQLLEKSGVSFDPADREVPLPLAERGTGLLRALQAALVLSVIALIWVLVFQRYYAASQMARPLTELHDWLRPSSSFGLACGVAATLLILANLAYLLRRNWLSQVIPGELTSWMTSHVVTGILALLLVLIHAALAPRNTVGGHACFALGFLVVTGAIGRYFYSFVPRAANGKEVALEELTGRVAAEATAWDRFDVPYALVQNAIHPRIRRTSSSRWPHP